jgi:hypothetical protein
MGQIPDGIIPAELYPDGKSYSEDETYALRFKLATENGIVREYGRRKSDNEIVMINVKEVTPLLKKMEKNTDIV